jgi:hypothetical protein
MNIGSTGMGVTDENPRKETNLQAYALQFSPKNLDEKLF